jgi:hypothetical protein
MKITLHTARSALIASCAIGVLLALGGCASPASREAMIPVAFEVPTHHQKSVGVVVAGGQETSAMGKSQVSDVELQQAVIAAIQQSKTFSKVVDGKNGDYILSVNVFNVSQPSFGFSFTVGVEMGWTLTRADTGAKVWQESIKSEHTASATDAFAGTVRLRMATEGAIRNNVAKGLTKISTLSL